VKREQVATLIGGFAFGVLVGFGISQMVGGAPGQRGPSAPPAGAARQQPAPQAQSSAPMLEEIGQLREVLRVAPDNIDALKRLANIYQDAQMYAQAIEFYEKAVALKGDDPNLMTDLGTCLGGVGRNREALAIFRQAHEMDPAHWQSMFNTVIIAGLDMHDFKTADAAMKKLEGIPAAQQHLAGLRQALEGARTADEGHDHSSEENPS
jgi:tetratricopeptide (TPR) repeat protein